MAYVYLDQFFFAFHTALVLFVLTGWLWRRTRPWHLGLVFATAFSWGVLGIWYGFGYCPCTDWHWQVRYRLGYDDMPASYLKYLADRLLGQDFNPLLVDNIAIAVFVVIGIISLVLCLKDWFLINKKERKATQEIHGESA
jgi:hypothetical protein